MWKQTLVLYTCRTMSGCTTKYIIVRAMSISLVCRHAKPRIPFETLHRFRRTLFPNAVAWVPSSTQLLIVLTTPRFCKASAVFLRPVLVWAKHNNNDVLLSLTRRNIPTIPAALCEERWPIVCCATHVYKSWLRRKRTKRVHDVYTTDSHDNTFLTGKRAYLLHRKSRCCLNFAAETYTKLCGQVRTYVRRSRRWTGAICP